jgi:hypothetical protein
METRSSKFGINVMKVELKVANILAENLDSFINLIESSLLIS